MRTADSSSPESSRGWPPARRRCGSSLIGRALSQTANDRREIGTSAVVRGPLAGSGPSPDAGPGVRHQSGRLLVAAEELQHVVVAEAAVTATRDAEEGQLSA